MKTLNPIRADIIGLDAQDKPVLLIEVKGRRQENAFDRPQLITDLQEAGIALPFAMLVTLEDTRIFEWDGTRLSEVLRLPTADALSPYDPEFSNKNVYQDYLIRLVEAWLRDVAYHWRSEVPPFREELERIGLADRIKDGDTKNEDALDRPW